MKSKPKSLPELLAELERAQLYLKKHGPRFIPRESAAIAAVAKYRAKTMSEFALKLGTLFNIFNDVREDHGDSVPLTYEEGTLLNSIMLEAGRIFCGDDPLVALMDERRQIARQLDELSSEGDRIYAAADARHPNDANAHHAAVMAAGEARREKRMTAALEAKYRNECAIARRKPKSWTGAAVLAELLPIEQNGDHPLCIVNDENYARIAANLASFFHGPAPIAAATEPASIPKAA